ncbi:hypothetical protein E2C01_040439 [Portunus trituberculatus]|uniref:Uncharacterized protein n=1 Tax=Portunus trituberculatus TaxID=210409 RepID=A0A5B7FNS7_PORTR|nr:hypothetical protein [Portunus trituberculatus]
MARQVDKIAVIGPETSQSQCCKMGKGVFKRPQLMKGASKSVPSASSLDPLFPSGPVTCRWPVPTLCVYPALLFSCTCVRTVWSSGDPVPASLRKELVADILAHCPALLSVLVTRIRPV